MSWLKYTVTRMEENETVKEHMEEYGEEENEHAESQVKGTETDNTQQKL